MKTFTVNALIGSILAASTIVSTGTAFASNKDASIDSPACADAAKSALAKSLKTPLASLKFYNGAVVGDGVDSVEVDTFQVAGRPGLIKIELDAEECSVRNIETLNN